MLDKNIRICEVCHKQFERRGTRIDFHTCSYVCAGKRKTHIGTSNHKCLVCDKEFIVKRMDHGRRKTCSVKCRSTYMSERFSGPNNHLWRGGTIYIKKYKYIKSPNHPSKNSGDYVAEHRLVMEKSLGRYLTKDEEVHHLNSIKDDNRLENLAVVKRNNHRGETTCPHCQKNFYIK